MLQYYVSSCFIHLQLKADRKLQVCICHSNKENDLQDTQPNDVIVFQSESKHAPIAFLLPTHTVRLSHVHRKGLRNTIQAGTHFFSTVFVLLSHGYKDTNKGCVSVIYLLPQSLKALPFSCFPADTFTFPMSLSLSTHTHLHLWVLRVSGPQELSALTADRITSQNLAYHDIALVCNHKGGEVLTLYRACVYLDLHMYILTQWDG